MPALIAHLEVEQAQVAQRMADPDLYKQKPADVQKLHRRHAELDTQLMETLEKWESIEARSKA